VESLVEAARRVRDAEDWLTQQPARTELPGDSVAPVLVGATIGLSVADAADVASLGQTELEACRKSEREGAGLHRRVSTPRSSRSFSRRLQRRQDEVARPAHRRRHGSGRVSGSPTAVFYDIHGNLVALEAVLAEAATAGATSYLLGGDYAAFGPWPRETVELLETLPAVARIRGNADRWLRDEPEVPASAQQLVKSALAAARESLGPSLAACLYELPERAELDGMLVCHGSPLSDIESFASEAQPDEARMLAGEAQQTILFGHSHQQFRRPGPDGTYLLNPGSVGMPLDGDRRAAWAILHDDGRVEHRRVDYDVEAAAAALESRFGDVEWTQVIRRRVLEARA
jgi:diadenosine tetraphosphatase ApaH/serine/threonine PP2A family protein phosphatase